MTPRHGVYLASGIAVTGLLLELAWFVIDPKGDTRRHVLDRLVRVLDHVHL